jgi:hypothetical protein
MSKQSLEEAVKLRNIVAYDLKVSVLSIILGLGVLLPETLLGFEAAAFGGFGVLDVPLRRQPSQCRLACCRGRSALLLGQGKFSLSAVVMRSAADKCRS